MILNRFIKMKSFKQYISERLKIHYRKGRKVIAVKGSRFGETGIVMSMCPGDACVNIKLDDERHGQDSVIQQNPKFWKVMK